MVSEFVVDVKRKGTEPERWTARTNGATFEAVTEAALRDMVHDHLLASVSEKTGVPEARLGAKLTRTWRVRVDVKDEAVAQDDDIIFDLFA